jgi:hypothetical protein
LWRQVANRRIRSRNVLCWDKYRTCLETSGYSILWQGTSFRLNPINLTQTGSVGILKQELHGARPAWEANWFSVGKFTAFYGTRRFITVFTTSRHLPLYHTAPRYLVSSTPPWEGHLNLNNKTSQIRQNCMTRNREVGFMGYAGKSFCWLRIVTVLAQIVWSRTCTIYVFRKAAYEIRIVPPTTVRPLFEQHSRCRVILLLVTLLSTLLSSSNDWEVRCCRPHQRGFIVLQHCTVSVHSAPLPTPEKLWASCVLH